MICREWIFRESRMLFFVQVDVWHAFQKRRQNHGCMVVVVVVVGPSVRDRVWWCVWTTDGLYMCVSVSKTGDSATEAGREYEGHAAVVSVDVDSTSTTVADISMVVDQTGLIVDLCPEISFPGDGEREFRADDLGGRG